ncbi:MAG: hypothetical protein AAF405_03420 [Pseudomonadota bacterium]
MSVLSILASMTLVGLVYGLSFLPSASLARPEGEVGVGLAKTIAADGDAAEEHEGGKA